MERIYFDIYDAICSFVFLDISYIVLLMQRQRCIFFLHFSLHIKFFREMILVYYCGRNEKYEVLNFFDYIIFKWKIFSQVI